MKNDSNIFRLQCEPRSSASREDHHTRLIEYDDRMRQEEKKYSRLLMELNKSRFLDQSGLHKSDELKGFATYDDGQTMDEGQSAELEVTRLTGDEILHGCGLTMEQVLLKHQKSLMLHDDGSFNRTNTQYLIAFECTLSLQEKNDSRASLMGMMQVVCSDIPGGKESIPWQSVMIESGNFDLQGWTGVCSSSLPVSCKENEEKHAIVYNLFQEKQNRNEE